MSNGGDAVLPQSTKSSSSKGKDKFQGLVVLHKGNGYEGVGQGSVTTAISDNINKMNESSSSVSLRVPPHKGKGKDMEVASLAPECLELRSAIGPFSVTSGSVAPRMACVASVVALLHRGKLELVHAAHGVRLPFPNPTGLHRGTCLAASATLLAVGSECGGVSMYDPTNMKLVMLIPASVDPLLQGLRASRETPEGVGSLLASKHPSSSKAPRGTSKQVLDAASSRSAGGLLPHFNAGGKIFARAMARTEVLGAPTSTGSPPAPVVCMKFICNGNALVVLQADGVLTVTDVSAARDACNDSSDIDANDNDAASATGTVHPTLSTTLTTVVSLDMLMLPPSSSASSSSGVHWSASSASAAQGSPDVADGKDLVIATCFSRAGQPEAAGESSNLFAVVRGQTAAMFRVELASAGPAPIVTAGNDSVGGLEVHGQGLGLGHAGPSAIASAVHAANCPASLPAPTQTPPRVHPVLLLSLGTNSLTEVLPLHNPLASPVKPKKTSGGSIKGKSKKSRDRAAAAMMAEKLAAEKQQQPMVEEDHPLVKAYQLPVFERSRMDFSEPIFPATAPYLNGEGAHLVLSERGAGFELTLYLVCHRDDSEDVARLRQSRYPLPLAEQLHLYCGSVVLGEELSSSLLLSFGNHCWQQRLPPRIGHHSGTTVLMMPMHPVLNLGSSLSSLSFRGVHCALVVPQGCFLLDLDSASAAARELQKYAESTVAVTATSSSTTTSKAPQPSDNNSNNDDDESTAASSTVSSAAAGGGGGVLLPLQKQQQQVRGPPTPLVCCRALSQSHTAVGNDATASWSGGAVSITAGHHSSSSGTDASAAAVVSAVAFKMQKQVLLRLSFPATTTSATTTATAGMISGEQSYGDGYDGQGLASVVML